MYIRLFESGPGCDYIELEIKSPSFSIPTNAVVHSGREVYRNPEMVALTKVLTALFENTDIEEIGIGRERDKKKEEEK